jgi:DNA repair protein RecO (recombination protein O)
MNIEDVGYVLKLRKFQENSYIASIFTKNNGLVVGLLRRSRKQLINLGDEVHITWKARLEDHLGFMQAELVSSMLEYTISSSVKARVISAAISILQMVLNERERDEGVYGLLTELLTNIKNIDDQWGIYKSYALFELHLIQMLGYGLDLAKCIATEQEDELLYISPKSGAAVSRLAGEPYKHLLFKMPTFYTNDELMSDYEEIVEALKITRHFLHKSVFQIINQDEPIARIVLHKSLLDNREHKQAC